MGSGRSLFGVSSSSRSGDVERTIDDGAERTIDGGTENGNDQGVKRKSYADLERRSGVDVSIGYGDVVARAAVELIGQSMAPTNNNNS